MKLPVRSAVTDSPVYPFTAVDAPIKLDQNESPDDMPAELKQKVMQRLAGESWNRYPEIHAGSLAMAIARHTGWPQAGVVVAPGSNALIPALIQLAALDTHVVTIKPGFALYGLDAKLLGSRLTEVALRADFTIDTDAIIAAMAGDPPADGSPAGVLFLPQPLAPTGGLIATAALEAIIAAARGWLIVIDEAYFEFSDSDATVLARQHPQVVVMRTFSKAWGLAGLRVGYALASEEMATQLRKLMAPFGLSVLQSVAVQVALESPALMQERVAQIVHERDRIANALAAHPSWEVVPSQANFLLIRTPDAAVALQGLLDEGVLVRRQDGLYGLKGCIRVSVGTPAQNDAFLNAARRLA